MRETRQTRQLRAMPKMPQRHRRQAESAGRLRPQADVSRTGMKNSTAIDTGCSPQDISRAAVGLTPHQQKTILNPGRIQSTRALAEAMRTAMVCGVCPDTFATGDPRERLCDDCRAHVFAADVPW